MKIIVRGFVNTMTKPQRTAGLIYLPFYMVVLPLFVVMLAALSPETYNDVTANAVYYGIGLIFCLVPLRKYLRSAFDVLSGGRPQDTVTETVKPGEQVLRELRGVQVGDFAIAV